MDNKQEIPYARSTIASVYATFRTGESGLTADEAAKRIAVHGRNEVAASSASLIRVFFRQYANFLMLLLMGGTVVSMWLGEWADGLVILGVLIVNGILGTVQEYRAEKLAALLSRQIPRKVLVRREGVEKMVERGEVVPGDVVIMASGGQVPADARVVRNFGAVVDESALTGESIGAVKQDEWTGEEGDERGKTAATMLYAGTCVTQGGCEAVVTATGANTEFGKIAELTQHAKKRSSFLIQVNGLSSFLFRTTLVISLVLFIALMIVRPGLGWDHVFLFTVALSIAIVPEMLPLISTLALTRASLTLSREGVLTKRLSALEDLGGVTMICTDKTGTLTENVLSFIEVAEGDEEECLRTACICATEAKDPDHILAGSFDGAIWKAVNEEMAAECRSMRVHWRGSFDPMYRWQFSVFEEKKGAVLAVKGAPEHLIPRCRMAAAERARLLAVAHKQGEKGMRLLAVARKKAVKKDAYTEADVQQLTFVGFLVFTDPVKATAAAALTYAHALGIHVKILTGDSAEVARAVAAQVGMRLEPHEVVTGDELARADHHARHAMIRRTKVFARVSPSDKYDIISALSVHESVMFLGEGINDAPALKRADVGMVVEEASDIAKESADIVLTKPDLGVLVESIRFGRQIMGNIARYILITLTGNFGTLYAISAVAMIAPILPLLPVQILLENLLTDVPMISMVMNPYRKGREPRRRAHDVRDIALTSLVLGIGVLGIQLVFYKLFRGLPEELFRTLWLVEIVLIEFILIISLRTDGWWWQGDSIPRATWITIVAASLGIIVMPFIPGIGHWFGLVPYPPYYLLPIAGLVIAGLLITELIKHAWVKKFSLNR